MVRPAHPRRLLNLPMIGILLHNYIIDRETVVFPQPVKNVKPNLAFDLFTVQNNNLLSDGTLDPAFTNFGLAWYQSDIQASRLGTAKASIQTILLNQIFGFDPAVALPPTNTLHIGFWFNNPADAATCGFSSSTPFNGEHNAGPLAMISVPDPTTGLGPLCLNPNTSTTPATCNP
jgi:hypothetical protein